MTTFSRGDVETLAAKLAGLDLTPQERAALDALLVAAGPEVRGHGFPHEHQNPFAGALLRILRPDGGPAPPPAARYIGETEKNLGAQ